MPTSQETTSIGFIGLGHMGGSMAARFLAAGHTVYGEERSRDDAQHLVDAGLQWRGTPREVALASHVIFSSVPDDDVLWRSPTDPTGSLPGSPPARSGSTSAP